jgi:hypothetical protein
MASNVVSISETTEVNLVFKTLQNTPKHTQHYITPYKMHLIVNAMGPATPLGVVVRARGHPAHRRVLVGKVTAVTAMQCSMKNQSIV